MREAGAGRGRGGAAGRRRRVRRLRGRRHRAAAVRPRPDRDPRRLVVHAAAVACARGWRWSTATRTSRASPGRSRRACCSRRSWSGHGHASSSCSSAPRWSTSSSRATPTGGLVPADTRDDAARPCYDARGLTRMYDHLTGVSAAMNAMGWGNYANDHEDANGQFEQNFAFADALTTADRVITTRYLISVLAEQRDMVATFMPKPFGDRTGSGLHLHLSLWRDGESLFPAGDDPDARGHGLSPLAYAFLAGILDHATGHAGGDRADGELLQAHRRDLDPVRRHVVAPAGHLRRQRPHPLRAHPGRQPHRDARRRRLGQPVPRDRRLAGRRPRRDRARPRPGRRRARGRSSRRRCCTPSTRSPPTRSSPAPSTPPARA